MHHIFRTLPLASALAIAACNQAPTDTAGNLANDTLAEAGTLPPLAADENAVAPDEGALPAAPDDVAMRSRPLSRSAAPTAMTIIISPIHAR